MSLAVDFRAISKSFGLVEVLHGVSFRLEPGRVIGLLGENGAGKSTLVKILSGYEQASAGDFTINGVPHRFTNSREAETMIHAYDEIIDFIAAGTTPDSVVRFEPSQRNKDYVAELIQREKTTGLTPDESSELEHFMNLEHIMRLAKARARSYCSP